MINSKGACIEAAVGRKLPSAHEESCFHRSQRCSDFETGMLIQRGLSRAKGADLAIEDGWTTADIDIDEGYEGALHYATLMRRELNELQYTYYFMTS